MDIENLDEDDLRPSESKADEAALELMKQLITLASGVLALSAAFVDKLPKAPGYLLSLLFLSWLTLVGSIYFGLKTISAIVKSRLNSDNEWSKGDGRKFGRLCQSGFLSGIALFAGFTLVSLILPSKDSEIKVTIQADDPRIIEIIKSIEKGREESHSPNNEKEQNNLTTESPK